jgi:hypothetical protein
VIKKRTLAIIASVLVVALPISYFGILIAPKNKESPDVFVGIDVAYADQPAIYRLIDKVNPYINLFVIGSTGISYNETKLDETCQYLYNNELSFIIYTENNYQRQFSPQWFENAKIRWGKYFLGFYVFDEPAGKQLEYVENYMLKDAENSVEAANLFVYNYEIYLNLANYSDFINSSVFTSDYALYWFDYRAGYDVVFAEFGWNYSRQLNVALNRGAATVQNKDWGTIITWTYNNPPYIESGEELYDDMVLAYENGAEYILVFDSNEDWTEGILEEEHFEALEQFWRYALDNPRSNQVEKRVAFVLPEGYGYGFRGPEDKIWGLWEADELSLEISYHLGTLLEEYENNLDIIYDDDLKFDEFYNKYVFWNGTIIEDL